MKNLINKIGLRPTISTITKNENQSFEEKLQNDALRPILKLQNDLIFAFFKNYLAEKKIKFNELTKIKKKEKIDQIFNQDNSFKTELKGIVIGLMTVAEYEVYTQSKKGFNKRIYTMAKERILSWF